MNPKIFCFCFCLICAARGAAQSDSAVSRRSLFVIPHVSYQQETSWAPGVAFGYYFKSRDISRISSVSGSAVYTLLNQFMFNVTPKIYFGENHRWYLYSNLNFRNYPDHYYGIGNAVPALDQQYISRMFAVLLQPQYAVSRNFYAGLYFSGRNEHAEPKFDSDEIKNAVYAKFGTAGWEPYSQISLGAAVTYDSRDNSFYPYRGTFGKATFALSQAGWGSTFSLREISLDMRKYISLFPNHVVAVQAQFEGIFGPEGIPFQMLPSVGGRDLMRGFRQGKYRENLLAALQAEYRFPIYKRIKAAVFCASGDVFDSRNFELDKWKFAYGAGLRCRLNDARVHLRLDIAKNNYGDKLQFYITATEAF